jgi:RHS repeat-associated protein
MAGISSKAAGKLENKRKYAANELQTGEFTDGGGLEFYDFNARTYDQQIGRFHQIDIMADKREWISGYNYSQNNPVLRVDPLGTFDFVRDGQGNVRWDNDANSQATTKSGETYLGKTLELKTVSYIDSKTWDGPNPPGGDASGVKLTTTVSVTGNENEKGELVSVTASNNVVVGETPIGTARDHYPGLGNDQNKFSLTADPGGYHLNMEQHASVSPIEEFGINFSGHYIVNVAQKLNVGIAPSGNVSISAATDIFPSATLTLNGSTIMQYNQPSFRGTHAKSYENVDKGRGENSFMNHYKPAVWYKRL